MINIVNVFKVIVQVFLVIHLLIMLAGDVETNPGPRTDQEEYSNLSICHINIRSLKPKLDGILYKIENFNYLNVAFISYKLTMWD